MACRLQLIWCSVLLQLVLSGGSTGHWSSQQQQQQHCQSKMQCAAEGSTDGHCGIFHFTQGGIFYLSQGTSTLNPVNCSCSGFAQSSDRRCVLYSVDCGIGGSDPAPSSAEPTTPAEDPIVQQLSLKLLYRFATNGLVNVADPSQSTLQPGSAGVPVDSDGAHFVQDPGSYLIANTSGFENIVNKNNTYSVFFQVRHPLNNYPTYVAFRQCNGTQYSHDFYTSGGAFYHRAFWPADGRYYESGSGALLLTGSAVSQLSVGDTFNMDHHDSFYFNGTLKPAVHETAIGSSGVRASWFQCFHLGGNPKYSQYSMQGSMSCFALSTRLLTLAEFVQLDSWCDIK